MSLVRTIERYWHMLRHVPASRLLRRLQLHGRWQGEAWRWRFCRQAPLADQAERLRTARTGPAVTADLVLPEETTILRTPIDWAPHVTDAESDARLAQQHYMEFLAGCDDAAFEALVVDWIAQNRRGLAHSRRYAWRPYNLSIRINAWIRELHRRTSVQADVRTLMHASLIEQTEHLRRFLETDLGGNHLIKNIKALLAAGRYFSDIAHNSERAALWHQIGERLLEQELAEQILSDGMHFERSVPYHCQVLSDLLEIRATLRQPALVERVETKSIAMAQTLARLLHPDGLPAQFNDGGLTMAPAPAPLLAALGQTDTPQGSFALADAGFYGWRDGGDYLIVDCGPMGPRYLIGHGHGDILSFEWSTAGRRIIVDQGTYQNLAGPRRTQSRATASHNTVTIDAKNQSDFFGAHRCGRRARASLLEWTALADGVRFQGTHDGYSSLQGGPRHIRQINAAVGHVHIIDRIEQGEAVAARAGLLLHPACTLEADDGGATLRLDDIRIRIEANMPIEVEPAEWFPNLHTSEETTRLVMTFGHDQPELEFTLKRLP